MSLILTHSGKTTRSQVLVLLVAVCGAGRADADEPSRIDFARDVQPPFKAHCVGCHGPKQQKNGFRLDRRRDAFKGQATRSAEGPPTPAGSNSD